MPTSRHVTPDRRPTEGAGLRPDSIRGDLDAIVELCHHAHPVPGAEEAEEVVSAARPCYELRARSSFFHMGVVLGGSAKGDAVFRRCQGDGGHVHCSRCVCRNKCFCVPRLVSLTAYH